ncbi:SOS response-associated peptidase [Mycolicibacter minnesotensis]
MCGRFAVTTDPALLAEEIDAVNELPATAAAGPNYNVAPTDGITTVVCRHREPGDRPTRRLRQMRWGLVPPWTKAGADGAPTGAGPPLINARADKVTTSPAFRSSAAARRCLVPMDGYYEWLADAGGPVGRPVRKRPFYIHAEGATLFAAGLWSCWRPQRGSDPVLSVTIITTDAVGEPAGIHHRMPLLLDENHWDRWLDPDEPVDTRQLARPPEVAGLAVREVSSLVNSVRNNSPELIAAATPQPEQAQLF